MDNCFPRSQEYSIITDRRRYRYAAWRELATAARRRPAAAAPAAGDDGGSACEVEEFLDCFDHGVVFLLAVIR